MEILSYHSRSAQPMQTLCFGEKEPVFFAGFELEKNGFVNNDGEDCRNVGEEVHPSNLFWKFETDSSCGVEAVTHVLPLDGVKSEARKEVFKLINQESILINQSPTDYRCGGHITISCNIKGYKSGINLADAMKHNLAIIYAMFRKRLKHDYCKHNTLSLFGRSARNSPINVKRDCIEIRLCNAIRTTDTFKNRYDLMFKLMKYSTIERVSWKQLKDEIKPNLMKMYNRNPAKVKEILHLADSFRKYLIIRDMDEVIKPFFCPDEVRMHFNNYQEI